MLYLVYAVSFFSVLLIVSRYGDEKNVRQIKMEIIKINEQQPTSSSGSTTEAYEIRGIPEQTFDIRLYVEVVKELLETIPHLNYIWVKQYSDDTNPKALLEYKSYGQFASAINSYTDEEPVSISIFGSDDTNKVSVQFSLGGTTVYKSVRPKRKEDQ